MPSNGNDLITWGPGSGSLYIDGLGDGFDSNVYQPYDLDRGMTTGDMLRIEGDRGAFVRLDAWDSGFAKIGAARATFVNVERVYGSAGNDTIRAGQVDASGPDGHGISIFAGAGNDNIVATRFGDVLDGGIGSDTIWAGPGDDFVQSSEGNDLIYGGAGQDNIRWGLGSTYDHDPGNDTIFGGAGHDLINVWVTEGPGYQPGGATGGVVSISEIRADGAMGGTATIGTGDGDARLRFHGFELGWTHEGHDVVDASGARVDGDTGINWSTRWGDDLLIGSRGNDTLIVDDGQDTVTGGAGDDQIWIGNERAADDEIDTLIFRAGHGSDTVYGYGADDILDLDGSYTATDTAAGTLLTAGQDSILLAGIHDFEV